jgi:hypothetical protein
VPPLWFMGTLLINVLLKNYLLTDDTCTADNQTASIVQLIEVVGSENSLDACLRWIGRCVTIVTPTCCRRQSNPLTVTEANVDVAY